MTPEERDDLLRNAPPEEGLEAKYEHLLHAFQEQGKKIGVAASSLRATAWHVPDDTAKWLRFIADELEPQEPLSEADAAEKFSQDAAARKK